jgi:hypothetical protein
VAPLSRQLDREGEAKKSLPSVMSTTCKQIKFKHSRVKISIELSMMDDIFSIILGSNNKNVSGRPPDLKNHHAISAPLNVQ